MGVRGLLRSAFGGTAIEFAVILPVLFLLFSGVVNFGLIIVQKHQLAAAMNVGALTAITQSSVGTIQSAITNATKITPLTLTNSSFCGCNDGSTVACNTTCTGGVTPGTYVTFTGKSSVNLIALDFILTNPYPVTETFTVRTG